MNSNSYKPYVFPVPLSMPCHEPSATPVVNDPLILDDTEQPDSPNDQSSPTESSDQLEEDDHPYTSSLENQQGLLNIQCGWTVMSTTCMQMPILHKLQIKLFILNLTASWLPNQNPGSSVFQVSCATSTLCGCYG